MFQTLIWGIGWLIILLVSSKTGELDTNFWKRAIILVFGTSIIVFVNLKWLLPYLYLQKKKASYYLFVAVMLTIVVWGQHSDIFPWNYKFKSDTGKIERNASAEHREEIRRQNNDYNFYWLFRNLPPLIISLLGSSFISFSAYIREKEKAVINLEKVNLETELKFLKSQINPHFLFNTLHNIYALTVLQPENASEKLLKLSNILRYMLYDSNVDQVSLNREIEYLRDYLDLVLLKDSRDMDINFESNVRAEEIEVAPLIFIPLVENAFKHSQFEDLEKGYIHISLSTWRKSIIFIVKNSKPERAYTKDKIGGIGLKNIRQRLNLIYYEKYKLDIEEKEDCFKVILEINCS